MATESNSKGDELDANPRTILFVHHSNDLYGADNILLETVKGLDRSRYTPFVLLPEDCYCEGGLAAELEKSGIRYRFLPLAIVRRRYFKPWRLPGYLLGFGGAVRSIRGVIREEKVAVVHSNTLAVVAGAVAARLSGTGHLWHVHEMLVSPRPVRKLLHFLAPRLSASVICISEAVRQHVLEDQPAFAAKLVVIPNGLSLEKFESSTSGEGLRIEFGVPPNAPFVGMIGRINHWKGQALFVEAAKLVLDEFPEARFLVVGSVFGNEHHYLDELISDVERSGLKARFLISGFRKDVAEVLAALDVYVHPSLLPEPFGLVVLEAMAAGKPVVVTAHGGPLEMIEDGISGYLVRPGNASELAGKINACLRDPVDRQRMGKCARKRAFDLFHVRRYLKRLQTEYDTVIARRR
jgi:glycosyltransferase involved in cell wall biosynthesis